MEGDPKQPVSEIKLPKTPEELQDMLEVARLDAVKLTARTVNHLIGNGINVAYGVGQMLEEDPDSFVDLKPLRRQAQSRLVETVDTLGKLSRLRKIVTTEFGGQIILDLDKSAEENNPDK